MNTWRTGERRRLQALQEEIDELDRMQRDLDWQPPAERPKTFEDAKASARGRLGQIETFQKAYHDPKFNPAMREVSEQLIAERLVAAAQSDNDEQFEDAVTSAEVYVREHRDE